jgi:hypothetical protein
MCYRGFLMPILCSTLMITGCLTVIQPGWAGEPGTSLGRTRTSVERLLPERLKAVHEDVVGYQSKRVSLPALPALTDYRASIHLHAEDSDHTGGTLPELLEDAKRGGVAIIMLSDHYRPPRDFMDGWRGMRDGVLFIPGVEAKGFLLYPDASIMNVMDSSAQELIKATTQGTGLILLSHVEERVTHPMDGLTGMEIYNRHADAKDDPAVLAALVMMMTDPRQLPVLQEALRLYHDEVLASRLDYPELYIRKWDEEMQKEPVVGIGAIDCHHNQVLVMKMVDERSVRLGTIVDDDDDMRVFTADVRPGIPELTKGHQPGDVIAQIDLDTYYRSFRTVSTHILAPELTEPAGRAAVRAGHAYVSHEWMCDPTGFRFVALDKSSAGTGALEPSSLHIMGDQMPYDANLVLVAEFPVECTVRMIKNGEVAAKINGSRIEHAPDAPGAYRVEGWLPVDGEDRVWIYSNPIYLR